MKSRSIILAVSFVFAALAMVWAAGDVTGKWTAQVPGRGGQTRETIFNFKVEGETLTGTLSVMQGDTTISDGKIKGDDLSFKVKLSFQGNDIVFLYTGKVAGDEIKFTRKREGGDQPAQEFMAKRAQ
jgi:hypothetical protein